MRILSTLAFLVLAPALGAQGLVWTVDDDGGADFATIQEAVDAALDADVIVVRDGTYAGFAIDGKALAVVAEQGHAPEVQGKIVVNNLVAGQPVWLRGLTVPFVIAAPADPPHALTVGNCASSVWVEDCTLHGGADAGIFPFGNGADIDASTDVVFHRSTLIGRNEEGLVALDSGVSLYDCYVEGAGNLFLSGNPGALVLGGTLFAQGGTFQGAAGSDSGLVWDPFNMVFVCTSAVAGGPGLWIAQDVVFVSEGPAATAPRASLRDVTLLPGAGGVGQLTCPDAQDGSPSLVDAGTLTLHPGAATGFHVREAPVRGGDLFHYDVEGNPGDAVFLIYSLGASSTWIPRARGMLHLDAPLHVIPAGSIPGSGSLAISMTAPVLGVEGLTLPLQALLVGGSQLHLTPPSTLVLLQPGL